MSEISEKNLKGLLSNVAELTSAAIAVTFIFQLLRNFIYYDLLFHVPIFQYVDFGDIPMLAPTFIFWIAYYLTVESANLILESKVIPTAQRIIYSLFLFSFAFIITVIGFKNSPVIRTGIGLILDHWYLIAPLLLYVVVRVYAKAKGNDVFKENILIGILILSVWYGIFDAWASYDTIVGDHKQTHVILKMKDKTIRNTCKTDILLGRTKEYWFFYNSKSKYSRVVKNDEVEAVDYDSILN